MGKYFFTRNGTCIFAFTVGGAYEAGEGFTVIGAHSDSPCFKIKPVTCMDKDGSLMLNTFGYGGGLWHTWFDRDLGIAGRCIIKEKNGGVSTKLVRIDDPIARIPNLAIHLTSGDERNNFNPNLHEHCKAILSMDPEIVNLKPTDAEEEVSDRLHPVLLRMMADQLDISVDSIEDMELQLIDTQPSTIGGAAGELILSGRLDNLCSCYQGLRAIIDCNSDATKQAKQKGIHMATFFDHEEVGSNSTCGAGSSMFMDTLRLIVAKLADETTSTMMQTLKKSFVVSIDMAHAKHPNYQGKHDSTMAPRINQGLVIKTNANQRYATNSVSATIFRRLAKMVNCPTQEFSVRSDVGCGSTIGPIIATLSGILTIDVGTPQFSMHSIREMMGSEDAYIGYVHLKSTLDNFATLQANSSWD
jgi:aspartyl aminopeptidase